MCYMSAGCIHDIYIFYLQYSVSVFFLLYILNELNLLLLPISDSTIQTF